MEKSVRVCKRTSEIVAFLTRKWSKELDHRLIKEAWAFNENRIAVRFAYEWHNDSGNCYRSYGNENWEFDKYGLMQVRHASINDLPTLHLRQIPDERTGC
jgi:nuclear transport factor 2 (NTF2) superfamily protein